MSGIKRDLHPRRPENSPLLLRGLSFTAISLKHQRAVTAIGRASKTVQSSSIIQPRRFCAGHPFSLCKQHVTSPGYYDQLVVSAKEMLLN